MSVQVLYSKSSDEYPALATSGNADI